MRVFKAKWFTKFVEKEAISNDELKAIANELEDGNLKVNLTAMCTKTARPRWGKEAGGYRLILFFKQGEKTFFEYAYPKPERDNIDADELKRFKKVAKTLLTLTDKQIENQIKLGKLTEIL